MCIQLENKPVKIVGASYYDQNFARRYLRKIMDAPGVNAYVSVTSSLKGQAGFLTRTAISTSAPSGFLGLFAWLTLINT